VYQKIAYLINIYPVSFRAITLHINYYMFLNRNHKSKMQSIFCIYTYIFKDFDRVSKTLHVTNKNASNTFIN